MKKEKKAQKVEKSTLPQNKKSGVTEVDINESSDERKYKLQKWGELSTARKVIFVLFGFLAMWSFMPAFFGIRGIGVISSTLIFLFISLTAYCWNIIEENNSRRLRALCIAVAAVGTVGLLAFCFVSGLMLKASITCVPKNSRADYTVVVLGCKAEGEKPSWMLQDRLDKAYKVLNENADYKCIVSGGMGGDESFAEAHVMKKYLVEKGIDAQRIIEENHSESTEENLLFSKAVIRLNGLSENIIIVTDRFHELRARIWAEKAGFKNIYSECCDTRIYLVIGYWFREMFGLARLYVFGR